MGSRIDFNDYEDDPEYEDFVRRRPKAKAKSTRAEVLPALVEDASRDVDSGFNPTFTSSRHEKRWIQDYLGRFYDDHLITDVLRQVKGGKEATVYCCRGHESIAQPLLAAKVYRPNEFRAMRNDAVYREGRLLTNEAGQEVRDKRALHAVADKTRVGRQILHATWLGQEFGLLAALHEAGADVPKPYARDENAILMTYVGDEAMAAPTLSQVSLDRREGQALFDRLLWNVELMLKLGCIHGDLSAYNILYWQHSVTVIDFPQAVDPFKNPRAYALFTRDVERLCQYFAKQGIRTNPASIARDMWARQVHPEHEGLWVEPVPDRYAPEEQEDTP